MELYEAMKKNNIRPFAVKMNGTGEYHVRQNKLDSER
jgi:hypothetical protein